MYFDFTDEEAKSLLHHLDEDWIFQENRCCQRVREPVHTGGGFFLDNGSCNNPAAYIAYDDYPICTRHAWCLYYENEHTIEDVESGEWEGGWEDFAASRTLVKKGDRWLSSPIVKPNEGFSWAVFRLFFKLKSTLNTAVCLDCQKTAADPDFDSYGGFCRGCWEDI